MTKISYILRSPVKKHLKMFKYVKKRRSKKKARQETTPTRGIRDKGSNARGLPFCAWEASQNQTRLSIPAFKVRQTTSDVESIWSGTITLVKIK